jgi:hypothetical protein
MVLPADGDADFHLYTVFDPNVPVGRTDLAGWTGPSSAVDPGYDVINCLSCHRSHGTAGGSHLRWDPTSARGCATCHISKKAIEEGYYICEEIDDCNDCHTSHGRSLRFLYDDPYYPGTERAEDEFGGDHENESLVWMRIPTRHYGDDVAITVAANPYDTYVVVDASDINTFEADDRVIIRCEQVHVPPHQHQDYQELTITSVDFGQNRYYFVNDPLHIPHPYPVGAKLYGVETRSVVFPITPASPYVRGADPYDGVCEVCHTQTDYWRNDGTGAAHYGGPSEVDQCLSCHMHEGGFLGEMPDDAPHNMHMGISLGGLHGPQVQSCIDCHISTQHTLPEMVTAGACDNCHSPGGFYNGVTGDANGSVGAADNWTDLVRQPDGSITPGKEKWCAGCHDDVPANSHADGGGIDAPPVAGDGTTWGFYVTGHGRAPIDHECIECHDESFQHIDDIHRTYTFDETDAGGVAGVPDIYEPANVGVAYAAGYRLKYMSGEPPLMIPSNYRYTFDYDFLQHRDNAQRLCTDVCHEPEKVFHNTPLDGVLDTNFMASAGAADPTANYPKKYSHVWGNGADINDHVSHIVNYLGVYWNSDWDDATTASDAAPGSTGCDSMIVCSSCHNVHGSQGYLGSTNEAMIRCGNLIDREPGYGFRYLVEDAGGYPNVTSNGATRATSIGAVFSHDTGTGENVMCIGCHGTFIDVSTQSYDASGWGLDTYLEYYRPARVIP